MISSLAFACSINYYAVRRKPRGACPHGGLCNAEHIKKEKPSIVSEGIANQIEGFSGEKVMLERWPDLG